MLGPREGVPGACLCLPKGNNSTCSNPPLDLGHATQPWSRWRLPPRLHKALSVAGSCVSMDGFCDSAGCHSARCAFKNASSVLAGSCTTSYLPPARSAGSGFLLPH